MVVRCVRSLAEATAARAQTEGRLKLLSLEYGNLAFSYHKPHPSSVSSEPAYPLMSMARISIG
jgi:hypothetical protein